MAICSGRGIIVSVLWSIFQPIPINTFSDISFNFNKEEGLKEKIEELTKRTNPNTKKNY